MASCENLNYATLAPQARPSGEILDHLLSHYSDILSMIIAWHQTISTTLQLCSSLFKLRQGHWVEVCILVSVSSVRINISRNLTVLLDRNLRILSLVQLWIVTIHCSRLALVTSTTSNDDDSTVEYDSTHLVWYLLETVTRLNLLNIIFTNYCWSVRLISCVLQYCVTHNTSLCPPVYWSQLTIITSLLCLLSGESRGNNGQAPII